MNFPITIVLRAGLCVSLVLGFGICVSSAQHYQGVVLDKETNLPIPYVNIGIANKNVGTVSSELGVFEMTIEANYDGDSLKFSSIGYEAQTFVVKYFKRVYHTSKSVSIHLVPKVVLLKEVEIISNFEKIVLGNTPRSKYVNAGFFYNRLGHEIATSFNAPTASLLLDSVQLNIVKCAYDSIFLRLNIYEYDDGNYKNILPKNIFINLSKEEALAKPMIDLQLYNLILTHNFLVSIEIVKDLDVGDLRFYAALKAYKFPGFYRGTSQDQWLPMLHKDKPAAISIVVHGH